MNVMVLNKSGGKQLLQLLQGNWNKTRSHTAYDKKKTEESEPQVSTGLNPKQFSPNEMTVSSQLIAPVDLSGA